MYPFVCILALIALTTHKWGASEHRGRSNGTVMHARTSMIPPFGKKHPSSGGGTSNRATSK